MPTLYCSSWNEFASRNSTSSVDVNLTARDTETFRNATENILRKMVFFAEDPSLVTNDSFTKEEHYVLDNYVKYIPTIMQQVIILTGSFLHNF